MTWDFRPVVFESLIQRLMPVEWLSSRELDRPICESCRELLKLGVDGAVESRRREISVDILKQYTERANEIIGERTADEEKYDREVIRWIRRGKSIKKAIAKANEKYPREALQVDNDNLADAQAHYEYLADHEAINEKLDALKRIGLDL